MAAVFDSFNEKANGAVVFTVPHAGRQYPAWLIDRLAVSADRIVILEDRLADLLVTGVVKDGWRTLIARQPRLMIDLNRAETDFEARAVSGARDPVARPSHRARAGLGLVPDRLGNIALWRSALRTTDLAERIVSIHRPWHGAVQTALSAARDANRSAILVDVHSMPPLPGFAPSQVVVGNRHGASAPHDVTQVAAACFREAGLRVAVNAPYAGAHMLERHGRPAHGILALQIEIDRRLYLDAALKGPGPGLATMQKLLSNLAARLQNVAGQESFPLAAE
jgi:N-formylglutamate amidohydrolase